MTIKMEKTLKFMISILVALGLITLPGFDGHAFADQSTPTGYLLAQQAQPPPQQPPAANGQNEEKGHGGGGPRKQLATIIFAGLGGAILGLSTLSFYGRPQDY